jgi:hypothetical protein
VWGHQIVLWKYLGQSEIKTQWTNSFFATTGTLWMSQLVPAIPLTVLAPR